MMAKESLTRARLKTPRAAAIAGMVFSVLLIIVFSVLRISVPTDPLESGEWLKTNTTIVALALNLIPFAGIAFLWFIGVLRDRLGQLEDRFFATVFVGSGLLFLAMLFAIGAVAGAIILTFAVEPEAAINSATFHFARAFAYNLMNIYVIKMAGVFMISTSTLAIFTEIAPRWIAFLGYALSLLLLFGSSFFAWSFVAFPLWVFLISVYILIDQLRWRVPTESPE
jgi:MFS family permease